MSYTTINTKFDIGDEVWVATRKFDEVAAFKCPVCNGTGANLYVKDTKCSARFDSENGKYKCKNGTMYRSCAKWYPKQYVIDYLEAIYDNKEILDYSKAIEECKNNGGVLMPRGEVRIQYCMEDQFYVFDSKEESEIFVTEQECQAECDRRNLEHAGDN